MSKTNPYKLAEAIFITVLFGGLIITVLCLTAYAIHVNHWWPQVIRVLAYVVSTVVALCIVFLAYDWWTQKRDEWDQFNAEGVSDGSVRLAVTGADFAALMLREGIACWRLTDVEPGFTILHVPKDKVDVIREQVAQLKSATHRIDVNPFNEGY